MKKYSQVVLALLLFLTWSCATDELNTVHPQQLDGTALDLTHAAGGNGQGHAYGLLRTCSSADVLERQLQENPGLVRKMELLEAAISAKGTSKPSKGGGKPGSGTDPGTGETPPAPAYQQITIPVVVHVLYNTQLQNISDAQIFSQIDVLNADFGGTNPDLSQLPGAFSGLQGTANIHFELANDRIYRKQSSRESWGTRDEMKYSSKGGMDAVDPETHLNIWVCRIGSSILGYAQFPGGNPKTDGVVIDPDFFGTTGSVQYPFNQGRTATHEVGHWLNLRHIWGDGRCNADDFVADTPLSDRPNYGCPAFPTVHCKTTDMTMNFMDYTDDACMYMFSQGQVDRMRAVLQTTARSGYIKTEAN
ncbi:zinc metalloprotease [Cesiribacter andamanensis]|uniref:Zinc-dependent metalloproteinase lipoprotein, family n=1 Tax=Cesiribacter andamanensis AMV16 TaxID=1279009 RepID=M7N5J2_9BACT|nr:zinc metalloprotease [Cesiribacter andamanensis]EMR03893.1 zinc-dependent metalloproteinase lipoprotein, family [Cesiribacter andamanensis AMV16]